MTDDIQWTTLAASTGGPDQKRVAVKRRPHGSTVARALAVAVGLAVWAAWLAGRRGW